MAQRRAAGRGPGCFGLLLILVIVGVVSQLVTNRGSGNVTADFRQYVGQIKGIEAPCIAATSNAQTSLTAASNGGDAVQAYTDAKTASDLCDQTNYDASHLTVPNSLNKWGLADVTHNDLTVWGYDWSQMWQDVEKNLQSNDIAAASDAQTSHQDADARMASITAKLDAAGSDLHVNWHTIASILPSHS